MLMENIPCPGDKSVLEGQVKVDNEPHAGRTSTLKKNSILEIVGSVVRKSRSLIFRMTGIGLHLNQFIVH
jgi:hypothetical protein